MKRTRQRWFGAAVLAAALVLAIAAPAHAAPYVVGERSLVAHAPHAVSRNQDGTDRLRVTIWYPAEPTAREERIAIGPPSEPFLLDGRAAPGAAPLHGRRWPVILLSHGYGGSARSMAWFATAIAREGYVVVAPDHPGNNGLDPMTKAGAALFFERPGDLVAAFGRASSDQDLGAVMDGSRVAAAGFSAGGFTALALAGAKVDLKRLERFCRIHPADGVCRPQKEFAVPIGEIFKIAARNRARLSQLNRTGFELRVQAVLAMAPAIVQTFTPVSLAWLGTPTTVIFGDADDVAPPLSNARFAGVVIPGARLRSIKGGSHYDFLAQCTAAGRRSFPLCAEQRQPAEAHAVAIEEALALFGTALADRQPPPAPGKPH